MEKINIQEIYDNARRDPSLFSTLDIENILNSIENEKNNYLENKTLDDVIEEIRIKLSELNLSIENLRILCEKLMDFRYVDEINELHKGKFVRWIRTDSPDKKLYNGGIVMDIKFMDSGVQVLCKNNMNRFIQYKFDECITFQKLNVEEQLLLLAYSAGNLGFPARPFL
jgi:hypothetical protein